jgi:hypothetical protein
LYILILVLNRQKSLVASKGSDKDKGKVEVVNKAPEGGINIAPQYFKEAIIPVQMMLKKLIVPQSNHLKY